MKLDEDVKKAEGKIVALEKRVDSFEKSIGDKLNTISKTLTTYIKKQEEEEEKKPAEEEEKKKEDGAEDDKDEEEKKKEDAEDKDEDEEEKTKADIVHEVTGDQPTPKPGQGEVGLPDAPGETDITTPPAGDDAKDSAKSIAKAAVAETLKAMGITKTSSNKRPAIKSNDDIIKGGKETYKDPNLAMLKKAKAGKLSQAELNRTVRDTVMKDNRESMEHVLKSLREEV